MKTWSSSLVGKRLRLARLFPRKPVIVFAYDHGLERGPNDIPAWSRRPERILEEIIGEGVDAVLLTPGIARLTADTWIGRTSLIVKITGRTSLRPRDEKLLQTQLASVEEAARLGADAVAATVYWGSPYEDKMIRQWMEIREKAEQLGMPALQLAYPRGPAVVSRYDTDVVMYSVRAAAETGADIIATYFAGDRRRYPEIIAEASSTPLLMSGGPLREKKEDLLRDIEAAVKAGAAGVMIGRNIFMREKPAETLRMIKDVLSMALE